MVDHQFIDLTLLRLKNHIQFMLIELCMLKCSKFHFDIDMEIKVTPFEFFISKQTLVATIHSQCGWNCAQFIISIAIIWIRSLRCVIEWTCRHTWYVWLRVYKSVISLSCLGIVCMNTSLIMCRWLVLILLLYILIMIRHPHCHRPPPPLSSPVTVRLPDWLAAS